MQLVIEPCELALASVAEQVHALHMAAYAKEAELIGAVDFAPLSRTVEDFRSGGARYVGAHVDGELVGVSGIACGGAGLSFISSFVVAPKLHRQGIGRALLRHVIRLHGHQELRLQTAVRNTPALALYRSGGFAEIHRRVVGVAEPLELVTLRRLPSSVHNVA